MDAIGNELLFPARHGQNERMIALNRKNALFAGSDGGAEHWATIASLIETCKLNDVDPLGYVDGSCNASSSFSICGIGCLLLL